MTNQGFWTAALEGTPDRLNASLLQYGATGSKPTFGQTGRLFWDTTLKQLERDNGSGWDIIFQKDPAAATAGLRTIGSGATQGAAGNHSHTLTDDGTDADAATTAGGAVGLGMDDIANGATKSSTSTVNMASNLGRLAGAGYALTERATSKLELLIDGVVVDTDSAPADQNAGIGMGWNYRVAGSRAVSSGNRNVESRFTNEAGVNEMVWAVSSGAAGVTYS